MFDGKRYMTNRIKAEIPIYMQNLLLFLVETMEVSEKDYLQVFELEETAIDGKPVQRIIHKQENPPYRKEHTIPIKNIVTEKIFIIDDGTHSTMLLSEEY